MMVAVDGVVQRRPLVQRPIPKVRAVAAHASATGGIIRHAIAHVRHCRVRGRGIT